MKAILLISLLLLTGCDLIKDLKYQYYYKYQGKIHCYRLETIKEEGEFATKIKMEKDPHSYTLSRLDQEEVDFIRQDEQTFSAKKVAEDEKSIWLRDRKGDVEITWIFSKKDIMLSEIIIEAKEGSRARVTTSQFSCR